MAHEAVMDDVSQDNVLVKNRIENGYSTELLVNATIAAIYQQGVLRPLEPLTLPEATNVQIQVLAPEYLRENYKPSFNAFEHRLRIIYDLLTQAEENWGNVSEREVFPQILQQDLKSLWYLSPLSHRDFCAMLELSAMHLDSHDLNLEQIRAFRFGLRIIEQDEITENDMDLSHDHLIDAGLPPSFSFDEATVQSYLDEF